MLRRTFAILWIFILSILIGPLVIFYVGAHLYLSEGSVNSNVLPQSYSPVTMIFAEQFARDPSEVDLFTDRIRQAIPQPTYIDLFSPIVKNFFDQLRIVTPGTAITLDLSDTKQKLTEQMPAIAERLPPCTAKDEAYAEFRLCYPTALGTNVPKDELHSVLNDAIQKEIPPRIPLSSGVSDIGHTAIIALSFLPMIIGIICIVGILILAAIAGLRIHALMMSFGGFLFVLGVMLGIIVFCFIRLPEISPIFTDLTRGEVDLIKMMSTQVFKTTGIIAATSGAIGIITMVVAQFFYPASKD